MAAADGLYALLAALGGAASAAAPRPVLVPLRRVSALVLTALAVRGAVTAVRRHRAGRSDAPSAPPPPGPWRAFATVPGITLLNPATVVYFAALVLGIRAAQPVSAAEQGVFVPAAFAASAGWQLLLAAGGALLGRLLTGRRGRLVTALVSSAVILAPAAGMLM
ncbi:LysE family efflux transporter [Streptomyces zinciresistens K42]|uniref:LysE family efflux transporter n=1 Tax=Streptomyces zinciresistens K42 TaxID=700597 RepID=G2GK04_9ACTN|nr:LysE family efflux transporter [Streptomyces zinciresistens K42]